MPVAGIGGAWQAARPVSPTALARIHPENPGSPAALADEASITALLHQASAGHPGAEDALLDHIYGELRRIAHREQQRHVGEVTNPATALAHEVYLQLIRDEDAPWSDRRAFFAAYTRALHNRLVDRVRRRAARGRRESLPAQVADRERVLADDELVALREHLGRLDDVDARAAEVFRVHFLVGLTIPEIASTLDIGHATVERDLLFARTWLHGKMRPL